MPEGKPLRDYRHSRAVVIGTWEYTYLPSIPAVGNSLRRMEGLLTGPLCGWPQDRLLVLPNEPGPGDLPDQLITAFEGVTGVALFYYVGHGQIDADGQLCLSLTGSRTEPSRRATTSLPFQAVRRALLDSRAIIKIVILDCCFAGLASHPANTLAASTADAQAADTLADIASCPGAYVMGASGPYATAWYDTDPDTTLPLTYFTGYLADLVEAGMPDESEFLRLHPLFRQLRENLEGDSRPVPFARNTDAGREFIFARNAAPPGNHRDADAELLRLTRRLAEAEAREQALIAEFAARTIELDQLREQARRPDTDTERRPLRDAIKEAERKLGETATARAAAAGTAAAARRELPAPPRASPPEHPSSQTARAGHPAPTPKPRRPVTVLALLILLAGLAFGLYRLTHGDTPRSSLSTGGNSPGRSTTSPPGHPSSSPSSQETSTAGLAGTRILTTPHSGFVVGVAVRSDRGIVAAAFDFGTTRIWKLPALGAPATVTDDGTSDVGTEVVIYGAAFSPDGKTLAAGGAGGTIYLVNLATGRHIFTLHDPASITSANVVRLAFSGDSQTLAVGDSQGNIYLWNVSTRQRTGDVLHDPGGSSINSLALAPDDKTLAEDDEYNGSTYLWNVSTGQRAGTLRYPGTSTDGIINSLAFSPDSQTLAAGAQDGSVYLWNVAAGHSVTLQGPTNLPANAVTFSPAGGTLAVGGDGGALGGEVVLWNTLTRKAAAPLYDKAAIIESVAFSNDGKILAAGDGNGATYLWPVR
jgi:WD40 repeat protein